MTQKMFTEVRFFLNGCGLAAVVALLNFLLYHLLARVRQEHQIPDPDNMAGYRAWITVPVVGVVAWRRSTGDLEFRW